VAAASSSSHGAVILPALRLIAVSEFGAGRVQLLNGDGSSAGVIGGDGKLLKHPMGMAVDRQGNLVIADWGLCQIKVIPQCVVSSNMQVVTPQGVQVRALGTKGSVPGQFDMPYDVAVDTVGCILVADFQNMRICVFRTDGTPVSTIVLPSKPLSILVTSGGEVMAGLSTGEIARLVPA
jgi:hypothetical protein